MRLDLPGALARLRRALPCAALALSLALPTAAEAADSLGAGGVVIPGSALAVGVSGALNKAGKIGARFSAVNAPLFWGSDTTNMNDDTAAVFALNTPSGLYSAQYGVDNAPFSQTSAPVLTGTGAIGDPFVVTSHFDATASIHITQTVTHVSGTTRFTGTWAITNGSGSITNMQAFEGADMYVNGNDNGTGTMTGSAPNRVIGSVASDGTQGQLIEQAVSPWNHYFSGMTSPFYDATGDSTYGYLPDTVDPSVQDSGEGVEWDLTVAAGATKTVSVAWSFTHPALPQAPRITGGVPAADAVTSSTSASATFAAATGDTANSIAFQCALDGGAFATCSSPSSLSGLADGAHTFSVRALNSAGDAGPQTDRTWTVDTTPPAAPGLSGEPTGTVAVDHASITITGERGATLRCSVDGAAAVTCTDPLVLSGLADGHHTVSVDQVDTAGNASTSPASASWTVDTSVPAAADVHQPQDATSTDADLAFDTTAGLTAECSLDGSAWQACVSPVSVTGLAVGDHVFKVRMVSAAGTPGAERTVTWTVKAPVVPTPPTDTTPSSTTPPSAGPAITPPACVSRRSMSLHWLLPRGARKIRSFKVLVDGKLVRTLSRKARSATVSLAGHAPGAVTVQVKAVAAAGRPYVTTRVYHACAVKPGRTRLSSMVLQRLVKG